MPSPLARLSQALSWLAFVAAVAFAIVWIVSGWRTWRAEWEYGRRSMIVLVSHGRLCVYRATLALPVRDRGGLRLCKSVPMPGPVWLWKFDSEPAPSPDGYSMRAIPLWVVSLGALAGTPPALVLWRRLAGVVRRRRGQCAGCGYDLRGLPKGARCPECGASR